jgi:tetraacyldisaccharide 4'-kinase
VLTTKELPRPVVSIGNITVGGTGKTPFTAHVARLLLSQGMRVAVLSRGYGGSLAGRTAIVSDGRELFLTAAECGDEPFLLAVTVPGLMVVVGSDRHSAGVLAMERLYPDIFLLDDGFQHLRLRRDLNVLLTDSERPFGNGWTLPAGLLREPPAAAGRADLVIRTRCSAKTTAMPGMADKPSCNARHRLVDALPLSGGAALRLDSLAGSRILAFAGIAEPVAFFEGLRSLGLNLVHTLPLPDHAVYDDALISGIAAAMQRWNADWALTTEKDGVKLKRLPLPLAEKTLLARLEMIIDDPAPLAAALRNLLQK